MINYQADWDLKHEGNLMKYSRREAIDYLHGRGYSRRLSAKLVDTTIQYDGALSGALEKAIERKLDQQKPKEKIKFIIKK